METVLSLMTYACFESDNKAKRRTSCKGCDSACYVQIRVTDGTSTLFIMTQLIYLLYQTVAIASQFGPEGLARCEYFLWFGSEFLRFHNWFEVPSE